MPQKRFTSEEIIGLLRRAEIELSKGKTVGQACKSLGVSRSTSSNVVPRRKSRRTAYGTPVSSCVKICRRPMVACCCAARRNNGTNHRYQMNLEHH